MSRSNEILLIDDQLSDIRPVVYFVKSRGYRIAHFANEDAARKALEDVSQHRKRYALAVLDIMISTVDIMEMARLDDSVFEDSLNTGIRLCEYARNELGISDKELPIVCFSARHDDPDVRAALRRLSIPAFGRVAKPGSESILDYLEIHLPKL